MLITGEIQESSEEHNAIQALHTFLYCLVFNQVSKQKEKEFFKHLKHAECETGWEFRIIFKVQYEFIRFTKELSLRLRLYMLFKQNKELIDYSVIHENIHLNR